MRLSTHSAGAAIRRPVLATVAVAVVLLGAATAAADGRLSSFRTAQVAPFGTSPADLVALPDLEAYGDVAVASGGDPRPVADAAAAEAATGLDVPEVAALPRGVAGGPTLQVVGPLSATFTVDLDQAGGGTTVPAPPGLDGTQVRLVAGPGVAQVWTSSAGMPALVVARAVAPSASSTGAGLDAVRDHLLTLPGFPSAVAEQLRAATADGSTLPLPLPAHLVTTSSADVQGVAATVLATRDRSMAAVVWVDGGVVTAVAGALDTDEVVAVARGLR